MASLGGKLTALECHPTKRVNKAEELNYVSTNIRYQMCSTSKESTRKALVGS
jgi:hypothetical protein